MSIILLTYNVDGQADEYWLDSSSEILEYNRSTQEKYISNV